MAALLNLSVNETLARTIMVAATMLIALTALLVLGPKVIFGFSAALVLGIFVATYSSIYAAAPMLIWLGVTSHSFVPTETARTARKRSPAARLSNGEIASVSELVEGRFLRSH